MEANKINILLTDEAKAFVSSLPEKAQKKVTFNIRKVEGGEMDKDLFKKLNDDIWELRTSYMECATVCWHFGIRNAGH